MADSNGTNKKKVFNNLLKLLLEIELVYFLAPVLSEAQRIKLKTRLLDIADRL